MCCSEVDNSIRVLRRWECEPLSARSNMPITLALSMTFPFFAPMYNKLRNIYHAKYVMIKAYKIQNYVCKGCPLSNLSLVLCDPLLIDLITA